ncbi:MAG: hypothetical protein GX945_09875 [Lentisphaerae bacterium]|jgi:hypothetical protein|nr:hypothetical protein [Lentisphaerota bacterium]
MLNARTMRLFLLALTAMLSALMAQDAFMPLCTEGAVVKAALQPVIGVDASLETLAAGESGGPLWRITFTKKGAERRFVPLAIEAPAAMPAFKALELSIAVSAGEDVAIRPAIIFFTKNGDAWYRYGTPRANDGRTEALRLNLSSLRRTNFSSGSDKELEWSKLSHFWLGFLADGEGSGRVEISKASLTSRPYVPTAPLEIALEPVQKWSIGIDKAATQKSAMVKDGDMELPMLSFRFPLGRHMFVTPGMPLPEAEYAAYKGLRLTYKAKIPAGINGLLILLHEGGGSFYNTIAVPASAEWRSIELPFAGFKMASWNEKPSGNELDVSNVKRITIGCHGTATGDDGEGEIVVKKLELLP